MLKIILIICLFLTGCVTTQPINTKDEYIKLKKEMYLKQELNKKCDELQKLECKETSCLYKWGVEASKVYQDCKYKNEKLREFIEK